MATRMPAYAGTRHSQVPPQPVGYAPIQSIQLRCWLARFGRHPLHDTDASDDEKAPAHFIREPVEQYPPIDDAERLFDQLRHDLCTKRLAEITKSKSSLDPSKLVLAGRIAAREVGNDVRPPR